MILNIWLFFVIKFVDEILFLMCVFFFFSIINEYFGLGIMIKNGIILNNEMVDFFIFGVMKVDGVGLFVVSRKI